MATALPTPYYNRADTSGKPLTFSKRIDQADGPIADCAVWRKEPELHCLSLHTDKGMTHGSPLLGPQELNSAIWVMQIDLRQFGKIFCCFTLIFPYIWQLISAPLLSTSIRIGSRSFSARPCYRLNLKVGCD